MKEFTVTISLTMAIPARNAEQAQERGDLVSEHITLSAPARKPAWWPEPDLTVEVEEQ